MVTIKQKPIVVYEGDIKSNQIYPCKKVIKSQKKTSKRGRKEQWISWKKINKMAMLRPSLSIIVLNVNGLSFPMQRHRVAQWN